jgi:hypothetical protein
MREKENSCECGSGCGCSPDLPARWKTLLGLGILLVALVWGAVKLGHPGGRQANTPPTATKAKPAAQADNSSPGQDCSKDCEKSSTECCGK